MDKGIRIPADRLKKFTGELLAAAGFTPDEAKAMADSLVLSDMLGHSSHGVMRVKEYTAMLKKGVMASGAKPKIVQDMSSSLTVDAQNIPGQAVMPDVLKKLYAELKTQAVVTAAIRNCGHIGRLGEWVEEPARAGYPGLLFVNGNGQFLHVAPPGGKKGVTDTNPLAFAIPLPDKNIFVTDMSTSAIAFGKIRLARMANELLPPDCIQDAEGNPARDPETQLIEPKGSLLPMGGTQGYKGFALSMLVDLLTAGLSGGQTPPAAAGTSGTNNAVLTLWNPEFFAGLEHMQREAAKYIDYIRASPRIDPAQPIRLAGDRMNAVKKERERFGVSLQRGLAMELANQAIKLNVEVPTELSQ